MGATAKLFMHGRSQAVRLPKEFRFEGRKCASAARATR
jgi:antitoxin VapB